MIFTYLLILRFVFCFSQSDLSPSFFGAQSIPVDITILTDVQAQWTLDSVLTAERQEQFAESPFTNPYFGYTTKPHWFKIALPTDLPYDRLVVVVNYPGIYDVILYDDVTKQHAGRKYPIEDWAVKARNVVFYTSDFQDRNVLYLRMQEEASLIAPIKVFSPDQYEFWKLIQQSMYGIFFGLIIAMILYNLMLFLSLHDITYLYYIIAMAAGGFVALIRSGYAILYWWPENPHLDGQLYLICGGVSIMASSRFAAHFLNFTRDNKFLDRYMWCITGLAFILIVLTFFFSFVELTGYGRFIILVGVPSYLAVGFISWRNGYKPARFFILAWIPYIAGLVLIVFKGGGWVPYHPLIDVSAEVGTSLEAILLSFALADRISVYKRGKAEAERLSLQAELEKQELMVQNKELDYNLQLREKDLQNEKQQLATTTLWLTQKNQVLQDIQKSLGSAGEHSNEAVILEVTKKISKNLNAEHDWERFKEHFEKVHSDFFTILQKDFPELTTNEQRLCAYLRMNLSSKEIALLQGVSLNAVEQARRRLRKKLGIANTETNLLTFLQQVS